MITIAKYAAITSLSLSAVISGMHFGSHGWLKVENALETRYDTIKDSAARSILAYTGRSEPSPTPSMSLNDFIKAEAEHHGISPILIEALIDVESNWKANAVRFEQHLYDGSGDQARMKATSFGYMQVLGSWAGKAPCQNITWDQLLTPSVNIQCGSAILSSALQNQKTVLGALIEYNGGARCKASPKCLAQASGHAQKVMVAIAERMIVTSK